MKFLLVTWLVVAPWFEALGTHNSLSDGRDRAADEAPVRQLKGEAPTFFRVYSRGDDPKKGDPNGFGLGDPPKPGNKYESALVRVGAFAKDNRLEITYELMVTTSFAQDLERQHLAFVCLENKRNPLKGGAEKPAQLKQSRSASLQLKEWFIPSAYAGVSTPGATHSASLAMGTMEDGIHTGELILRPCDEDRYKGRGVFQKIEWKAFVKDGALKKVEFQMSEPNTGSQLRWVDSSPEQRPEKGYEKRFPAAR